MSHIISALTALGVSGAHNPSIKRKAPKVHKSSTNDDGLRRSGPPPLLRFEARKNSCPSKNHHKDIVRQEPTWSLGGGRGPCDPAWANNAGVFVPSHQDCRGALPGPGPPCG